MTPCGVKDLGQHWFSKELVVYSTLSRYPNQMMAHPRNKLQGNLYHNITTFILENGVEISSEKCHPFLKSQCVDMHIDENTNSSWILYVLFRLSVIKVNNEYLLTQKVCLLIIGDHDILTQGGTCSAIKYACALNTDTLSVPLKWCGLRSSTGTHFADVIMSAVDVITVLFVLSGYVSAESSESIHYEHKV